MIDPTNRANPALAAYAQALDRSAAAAVPAPHAPVQSFTELLAQTLDSAVDAGRHSEAMAQKAALGTADLQDLVEAVNAAELSLQSVVAVRDRIIGAYQDIMRMPI